MDLEMLQRIREPLHNLIVFNEKAQLDRTLWKVVCSRPFQRLRRIKQLGFSEIVDPGATHSRFAHSLGVLQTASELMRIVQERSDGFRSEASENIAMAASLLHDIGHGPFSHAFEAVGKHLNLELADHEQMSDLMIRTGEIADVLEDLGSGFANDVAKMILKRGRPTVHNAIVSSQFDADRLDYMRRDQLMTGSKHSSVDFAWLLDNLEIEEVRDGVDDLQAGTVPTFVIGPKAIQAAESYVLGLFQLYPTIYFHKTTRGAEKLFVELLIRVVRNIRDGRRSSVGLPKRHPLIQFAKHPDELNTILSLDDAVIWGSLSQLSESKDGLISSFARRLRDRKLFECLDIRTMVHGELNPKNESNSELTEKIDTCCERVLIKLETQRQEMTLKDDRPSILLDTASRSAYKTADGLGSPTERINVKMEGGELMDIRRRSRVVASIGDFKLTRAYIDRDQPDASRTVREIIQKEIKDA